MGSKSKRKGAVGERDFALFCREHGYDVHRTAQHMGKGGGEADVRGLPGVHVEVKRTEALRLWDALEQAGRDAKPGEIPIVAHRPNNRPWIVILSADDFMQIYRGWEMGRSE